MARIPDTEIERIKREVSVERLVEASGIALKRTGKDLFGRCPFHADDTASLSVTPAKNLWHCLGACQTGGDVFAWVMRTRGVSFRHAYELLRADPSLAAASIGVPIKQTTVRTLPAPVALDADDEKLLSQVIGYYHETLKDSPEALAYLERRGIDHREAIERFQLGFANRTLGLRLPQKNRKEGEAIRVRLQRLGILRDSGHEHFNGSLVIPVIDEQGRVSEIYGRKITEGLPPATPKHLYLPREGLGIGRGVWNIEALKSAKELIVCEALIDALTFWCAGYRNVTAAYGVEGFTGNHLAAFKRYGTERILIAYDRDEAGEKAAERLASRLMAEGIECWRIQFPKGMDANDYALKVQPATKSLGVVIRKALWLGKGAAPARAVPMLTESVADRAVTETHALEITSGDVQCLAQAASSLAAEAAKEERIDEAEAIDPPELEVAHCDLKVTPVTVTGAHPLADFGPLPVSAVALPASPVPPAIGTDVPVEVKPSEIVFRFGAGDDTRRYRVRGLQKNLAYDVLKVNVAAERGERLHVDTLDLRASKPKALYIAQAARELDVLDELITADLRKLLRSLEALQEQHIQGTLVPKPKEAIEMTDPERAAAHALLRAPDLIERIVADLTACGLVGERTNKLVGYLAATSRKLEQPLAVLVQSSSAAGKSSLMDAILALMPEEERIKYSAVTGQSLFYLGEADLKHKVLAIVEEEGASRAAYALKLLQSEGELMIASTGKDPQTGELKAQEYKVEGPVMLFTTTTAADIDPELQNRCLVLSIDEGREQTRAIHALQRNKRTLEGLIARARKSEILAVHRNAQRLLKPLGVLNPYAPSLTFPDTATRLRRDHEKYLTLIDTIALLHQMQRPIRTTVEAGKPIEYVEATLDDIALANQLAHEVLGRSLDELPPQTRRVLIAIDRFVSERAKAQATERSAIRFSRRALREAIAVGDTQLKIHLARLVELEYVIAHRKGPASEYELVYDGAGQDGRAFIPGLIDVERLRAAATMIDRSGANHDRSVQSSDRSGSGRSAVGSRAGGDRVDEIPANPHEPGDCGESASESSKTHLLREGAESIVSYPQQRDRTGVLPLAAASSRP